MAGALKPAIVPSPVKGKFVMLRIALFAVAFLAAAGAQAQVHKCVDAAGKIIYTQDLCPANAKSGTMSRNVLSAPVAAPAPAASPDDKAAKGDAAKGDAAKKSGPKTTAEQEQEFRKRQQDQAKAAKQSEQKSAEAQAKEQNCRNARERLAQYEIGGRPPRIHPHGRRYYMGDAQIEQEKTEGRPGAAPTRDRTV